METARREVPAKLVPDFPQQPNCKKVVVLAEHLLWNKERNSVLHQEEPEPSQMKEEQEELKSPQVEEEWEDPEPPQMKVEQEEPEPPQVKEEPEDLEPPQVKEEEEELFISQEGEQLVVKLEADAFMVTLISEENQQSEAEPNSEQLLFQNSAGTEIHNEEGSWRADSKSAKEEEPKPKKRRLTRCHSNSDDDSLTSKILCENEADAPQLHDCKEEEEVLTVPQLCNQGKNSSLDQEEQDAAQVKEEETELCISQEEEHFGLKLEIDSFIVTSADEDNDNSETKLNSEQLLSHNSPDTESQDQESDFPWQPDCKFKQVLAE
ncbi:uncharacterized protein KZ484_011034 [Pholidichthys leucotaenia]